MAYKVFTNGSVLNASEVNDNLMNQAVITFTNSTARASAITSPVEGMVTYLADTDAFQFWNGSAWTNLVSSTVGTGNAIINGAFEINQRNFSTATTSGFGFDRWDFSTNDGTVTRSAQTFTPGTAPVAGYESRNFFRAVTSGQTSGSAYTTILQRIEDVRTFAGQTVTLSFWAKAASGTPKMFLELVQGFGTGGSPSAEVEISGGQVTLSTSWARYTATVNIPSIAGKTIGTNNNSTLVLQLWYSAGTSFNARTGSLGIQSNTFDIWGVQLEAGSTATPFRRNANSLQGELAACQRYYYRITTPSAFGTLSPYSNANANNQVYMTLMPPSNFRSFNTSVDWGGNLAVGDSVSLHSGISSISASGGFGNIQIVYVQMSSGVLTSLRPYCFRDNGANTAFIGISAEL